MVINRLRTKNSRSFLPYYEEVIDLVRQAPLYNLSQFSDKIDKDLKIFDFTSLSDEAKILNDFFLSIYYLEKTINII